MITGFFAQIFVSDVSKAKKWYMEKLDFEMVKDYPEWKCALLKKADILFDVGQPIEKWGYGWKKAKSLVGKQIGIFFETDNIKDDVRKLKEKKVKFTKDIYRTEWGEWKTVLEDLDGNEISLVQEI